MGEQRREGIPEAAAYHSVVETLFHAGWWLPKITRHGVSDLNDKGWPITQQDANYARQNMEYLSCDVPKVSQVILEHRSGRTFEARWDLNHGCVTDIVIDSYRLCYDVTYSNAVFAFTGPKTRCAIMQVTTSPGSFAVPIGTKSVTLKPVQVRPSNRINDRIAHPEITYLSQSPVSRE